MTRLPNKNDPSCNRSKEGEAKKNKIKWNNVTIVDGSRNVTSFFWFALKIIDWKVFLLLFDLVLLSFGFLFFFPFHFFSRFGVHFQADWLCIVLSGILKSISKEKARFRFCKWDWIWFFEPNRISSIKYTNYCSTIHGFRSFALSLTHPLYIQRQLTSAQIDFKKFVFKLGDT